MYFSSFFCYWHEERAFTFYFQSLVQKRANFYNGFFFCVFDYLQVPIVIAALIVVVSCYLVLAPIIDQPELEYLYCTIFIFSGLILYYPFVYLKPRWARRIMSKLKVWLHFSTKNSDLGKKNLQILFMNWNESLKACQQKFHRRLMKWCCG